MIQKTGAPTIPLSENVTVTVYHDGRPLGKPKQPEPNGTPITIDFPKVYVGAIDSTNPARLTIEVTDSVGRQVYLRDHDDKAGPGNLLEFDIIIPEADFSGFLVTLLTGRNNPDEHMLQGWGVCHGTRIKFLLDHEAFTETARLFHEARDWIYFSQLYFQLPKAFVQNAANEKPSMIFTFNPALDADHIRKANANDLRPERLLLEAADRDVDVKVLLHAVDIPLFFKIAAGVLLFPFVGTDCFSIVKELLDANFTDTDEVQSYFKQSGRKKIDVQPFRQPIFRTGVMHAKILVADSCALSIGSPYGQSYNDSHDHLIDAPMRGNEDEFPQHDVGFAATGPVIKMFHENLKLLWDNRSEDLDQNSKFPDWPPPIPESHHGPSLSRLVDDGVCTAQVVRTLSAGRFNSFPDGEKGILEAYLRAIRNARDFIYLETQYFTDDNIGYALAQAMKDRPQLQTIIVLNIRPDVPFYPFKQRRLIHCIRKEIGYSNRDAEPYRFGVFTRWTHRQTNQRPEILPIYIHAKVGIVDNKWATVGSANLDGLSLDSMLVGDYLNREQRAIELNLCMLNGVDGAPQSDVVDILRRKLWAEHLGFSSGLGTPNIEDPELKAPPPGEKRDWLKLWHDRADAALQQLINNPTQPLTKKAQVLPWPDQNNTYKRPREHIEALGIKSYKLVPLKSTRPFDFKDGVWKEGSKPEKDF
jgi:phosphatidylserine/phosphatidylglycerophosphate/cardiolipin synthase-like enzyme